MKFQQKAESSRDDLILRRTIPSVVEFLSGSCYPLPQHCGWQVTTYMNKGTESVFLLKSATILELYVILPEKMQVGGAKVHS